tara:strand:+ start:1122 stop:2960 length:1839 start_codon:yes stop_codon:yes gene_type:complete
MAPTNVNIDFGDDALVRANQRQQENNRFNGVNGRYYQRVELDALAAKDEKLKSEDRTATGDPRNYDLTELERVKDEPAAFRGGGFLYVCLGFEEHPDASTYNHWLQKIRQKGFENYRFVYIQLTPTPSQWQTTEYLKVTPKHVNEIGVSIPYVASYTYSNNFDQKQVQGYGVFGDKSKGDGLFDPQVVESPPGSGFFVCQNTGTLSTSQRYNVYRLPTHYTTRETGRSEKLVFTTAGPGRAITGVSGSACTFSTDPVRITQSDRLDPFVSIGNYSGGEVVTTTGTTGPVFQTNTTYVLGEKFITKTLRPFQQSVGGAPSQFRFGKFNYRNAEVGELTALIQGLAGGELSSIRRIFIDAYPVYRDHQVAVDFFQGTTAPGPNPTLEYDPQLSPQMLDKGAVDLFPHLNHLGTTLKNGSHKLRTDSFLGVLNQPNPPSAYSWNSDDHAFSGSNNLAESEITNATASGTSSGFFATWDSKNLYLMNGFTQAELKRSTPLRPLDPELPTTGIPNPDGTYPSNGAKTLVPTMLWYQQFVNDIQYDYFRNSKTTHLIDNTRTHSFIGDENYPSRYVNPTAFTVNTEEEMKSKRYTYPQYNPVLRLYALLDVLDAYGIL